jgi:hypothetical protein
LTVVANLLRENSVKERRQAEGVSIDEANAPQRV